ncbi:rhomboid family intramembrane serine protease [Conexibacter sp. SYSU D00693]|uniref:rhomboid family intramembrane serine protease n=1 Tax=Conexibacter sp. SYSU D00693 TaxID=2812560 RepID=UPI00196B06B8|nr:rhomboid family intramembrane serine protease [Conexibacter sp. SYSU D00693]
MATCYRHPGRETGVSCSNCGRPICPDCMTPTPVGMRCPDCAKQRTQVRSLGSVASEPRLTYVIIGICVVAFLGSGQFGVSGGGGSELYARGALYGPLVADGEVYRLVTGGFLHAGLLHILFNMYLLYLLGTQLEQRLGTPRYAALYVAALLAGSFGALAQTTVAVTVGASGAVFGLAGAMLIEYRRLGIDPLRSDIGGLILFNMALSLLPGFNVSIGGHLGGLVGGIAAMWAIDQGMQRRQPWIGYAGCLLVAAAAVAGSLAIAGDPHDYF